MAKEDNVVLDETIDENWEPTFEEIQESLFSLSFEVASSMSLELRHRRIIKVPQVSFLNRWKVIDRDMFHSVDGRWTRIIKRDSHFGVDAGVR